MPRKGLAKAKNQLAPGQNMKKEANDTKIKVLSKDCIFHMAIFYWFILHFSHLKKNEYQI
jgi:hypothetical protein